MISEIDVLIIGGGPAGISTALALLTYSNYSVAVIEQSDLSNVRVGEHVSPSVLEVLTYLKLGKEDFQKDCFTPSYGTTSFWGSDLPVERESIFSFEESSYQLDRQDFDFTLIEKLIKRGGHFIPRTNLLALNCSDKNGWKASVKHEEYGEYTIHSRFIIDASGRRAKVATLLKENTQKMDKLVGIGGIFHSKNNQPTERRITIESVKEGWWYHAVLRNNQAAVVFFTDADLISGKKINQPQNWTEALSKTRHLKSLLSGTESNQQKLWVKDASSRITNYRANSNVIAVGEAACAFDPISSNGIGYALSSGCQAARVVRAILENSQSTATETYQSEIEQHFSSYLQQRSIIYSHERRWLDCDFWKRRIKIPVVNDAVNSI